MTFPICQFLQSGALMPTNQQTLLIGYGKRTWLEAPASPAFYFPSFFLGEKNPWFVHEVMLEIGIKELLQTIAAANVAMHFDVHHWSMTPKSLYCTLFNDLQKLFALGSLKKAVPFVRTLSSGSLKTKQLAHSLISVLSRCNQLRAYPYGFWDLSSGMLGMTPEILFRKYASTSLETMACAGTCSRGPKDADIAQDPKEQYEHRLVVDDIQEVLSPYGKIHLHSQEIRAHNHLVHLFTPISLEMRQELSFEEIVRIIHPTAALGAVPRKKGKEWLLGLEDIIGKRERFGAPAGYVDGEQSLCLVAIRNMQWRENEILICAGSGVVPESSVDKEWDEIQLKLNSVKDVLGFA